MSREKTMREIGHFIGGKEVKGTSGRFGDVFNPNTGEVQARVALAAKSEVEQAIANAQGAFPGWAATNPQRRARVMFKFLELIQDEYDDLARLLSSEHGKTFADSKGDIQRGLEVAEFAHRRIFGGRRPGHRPLFNASAAWRRGRYYAVQFPGHDPIMEMRARDRVRQHLHP
jgi:acyl-CoA reductase-like NAD-dependent aldehyde dehydrogenase